MAWQDLVNIVRNLGELISPKHRLKDSSNRWIYESEFYKYVSDVRDIFKYLEGQENFTGQSAKVHLKTLCELLETLGNNVSERQVRGNKVQIGKGQVDAVSIPPPKAVYLEREQYQTIDGLRSNPQKHGYLEAGKFSEYVGDVARVFKLLREKGEKFLGADALERVEKINQQLNYLKGAFDSWQTKAPEGAIKRIELKEDYPTLRKFV